MAKRDRPSQLPRVFDSGVNSFGGVIGMVVRGAGRACISMNRRKKITDAIKEKHCLHFMGLIAG